MKSCSWIPHLAFILLSLLTAGCAEIPPAAMTKVCVSEKQDVGSRVWVTEFSRNGTITEVVGPSRDCRNPELPILAIVKG